MKRELSGPVHCIIDIVTYSSTDCSVADQWTPIPMSEDQVGSDFVWTRFDPVQGGLMILLLPLTHVPLTVKQYWDHWQCEHSYSLVSFNMNALWFLCTCNLSIIIKLHKTIVVRTVVDVCQVAMLV